MKFYSLPIVLVGFAVAACSGGSGTPSTSGETGELVVEATDKPFAYDLVVGARVDIDEIRIHQDAGADSGFLTLYQGPPIELDLLDLTNGATQILVSADLPVGTYHQLRLHVVGGFIELEDGDVFSTDLGNLHLTSTGTSGLKVFIDPPVEVVSQVSSTLLLDFDLSKTFQAVPGNDALNATSFKLKPVIHATNRSLTGEIRGVVREDDGTGTLVGVPMATVYLLPLGETDPANSVAATASAEDGSYALIGVGAGLWDLLAVKDPKQGSSLGVEVVVGNISSADLVIQ
jgi:hypothetical protein